MLIQRRITIRAEISFKSATFSSPVKSATYWFPVSASGSRVAHGDYPAKMYETSV